MTIPNSWLVLSLVFVVVGLVAPTAEGPTTIPLIPLGQLQGGEPTDAFYRPDPMDWRPDGEA